MDPQKELPMQSPVDPNVKFSFVPRADGNGVDCLRTHTAKSSITNTVDPLTTVETITIVVTRTINPAYTF